MDRFELFTILISNINRNVKKLKNMEMTEYNLKGIHASCIYYLHINNSLTACELCNKCAEDKATISRTLNFLEKNDYVVCKSNCTKRYNSPFELTEKGELIGKKIVDSVNNVLDKVNGCLSNEERINFYKSLDKISNDLEKIVNQKDLDGGKND